MTYFYLYKLWKYTCISLDIRAYDQGSTSKKGFIGDFNKTWDGEFFRRIRWKRCKNIKYIWKSFRTFLVQVCGINLKILGQFALWTSITVSNMKDYYSSWETTVSVKLVAERRTLSTHIAIYTYHCIYIEETCSYSFTRTTFSISGTTLQISRSGKSH